LPFRKRVCVVLRHAFDLSEKDTAQALGVSVGTVKSQTSKGMAELQRLLGTRDAPHRVRAAVGAPPRSNAAEGLGQRAGNAGGRDR
ncbi:sigma factor-like helix-turn-helix DNA-binding protein, partial [Streptomyces kebangsaanensis]